MIWKYIKLIFVELRFELEKPKLTLRETIWAWFDHQNNSFRMAFLFLLHIWQQNHKGLLPLYHSNNLKTENWIENIWKDSFNLRENTFFLFVPSYLFALCIYPSISDDRMYWLLLFAQKKKNKHPKKWNIYNSCVIWCVDWDYSLFFTNMRKK